jgi:segregation and condensation protein B
MNELYIRNVVEAALLAAGKPLQLAELGQLFEESTRPKVDDIRAALDSLGAEYTGRGVEVKETAAGFRIQVRRELSPEISRLWPERPARYSRALLETLALIAYRQPITRAEIEAVRGVAVNPNIVKTVIERNWVRVVGHRDVPGRPELLGTTREFLDYFGLRSLDELPPLAELKVMGDYNLQLELPNAGALGVEPKPDSLNGEGGAGLLTNDAANGHMIEEASDAEVAEVAEGAPAGANGTDGEVASDTVAAANGDGVAEGGRDDARDEVDRGVAADANAAAGEVAQGHTAAVEQLHAGGADVDADAEAERTLSAGEVAGPAASESDDPETADNTMSSESADSLDDDDADDDELSADGHGSRELVAAPHDLDD